MSVWVEIHNLVCDTSKHNRHAPRERVSWNWVRRRIMSFLIVTLLVSVWVEITDYGRRLIPLYVTLLVSVWVEILLKSPIVFTYLSSRSSWACELKWMRGEVNGNLLQSHAPRERVSWNNRLHWRFCWHIRHAPRERVSWNLRHLMYWHLQQVTLLVSVWVEIKRYSNHWRSQSVTLLVSVWVEIQGIRAVCSLVRVTLLVSVWVEIMQQRLRRLLLTSRSSWACELKLLVSMLKK